nr:aspyridones efflux protein apdf [Quercus suber]
MSLNASVSLMSWLWDRLKRSPCMHGRQVYISNHLVRLSTPSISDLPSFLLPRFCSPSLSFLRQLRVSRRSSQGLGNVSIMPDNTLRPTISFEDPSKSGRSPSDRSRSTSRIRDEIETPSGPMRRSDQGVPGSNHDEDSRRPSRWSSFSEQAEPPLANAVRSLSLGYCQRECLFCSRFQATCSPISLQAYGTYASFYMQHLLPGQDILRLNLVGSTQSFVVLALSAVVGRFLDAGYSRTLIIIGTMFVSLGTFLLSVVNKQAQYNQGNYGLIWLTQGFVSGLGMACFFVTSSQGMISNALPPCTVLIWSAVVATWFKKRKSLAIGIVASGASIAGLVYPIMTKFLITSMGFNNSVRCMAAVVTGTAIIAILVARPNPNVEIRKPEKWTFSVFIDVHAFKNAAFVWLCASISILFFGFYAVFFNLEEWAADAGLGYKGETPSSIGLKHEVHNDAIRTFYLLCIMNGASTIGRIGAAYCCDIFGALPIHAIVTFIGALLILLLWTMTQTVTAAVCFVTFFGIFSGAVIGLPPASVAYILGPDPKQQAKLGQWTGMMYTCAAVFALTGPVVAGHLITQYNQNYLTVQIWSGLCLFLSACCMAMAMYCRRRTILTEAARQDSFDEETRMKRYETHASDSKTDADNSESTSMKERGEKEDR